MNIQHIVKKVLEHEFPSHLGAGYAILDFPNYLNPGDSAIWLGTRQFLENLYGYAPSYVSTLKQFNEQHCRAKIGNGPIFFLGGGNFGDLYQKHNAQRLHILKQIPDNPVIFLPFSVANQPFPNAQVRRVIKETVIAHGNAYFFSREKNTHAELQNNYAIKSVLCPDLAHFVPLVDMNLGHGTAMLLRKDRESIIEQQSDHAFDWPDIPNIKYVNRIGKLAALCPSGQIRLTTYDMLAAKKVRLAMHAIATGRQLTTDRLHAMILASAMGIQVEALDNSTGKVASYYSTWKDALPNVYLKD